MDMGHSVLSLDVGSSGVKACLINHTGMVMEKETANYDFDVTENHIEQSPLVWWEAVVQTVSKLIRNAPSSPEAIFLTGQMQSLILMERDKLIAPAILYADTRAGKEIEDIIRIIGEETLMARTGNLNDASSIFAKLLWIKENAPQTYHKADHLLLAAHDFITWRLCGSYVTDYTNATTTGIFDLNNNEWAVDLLDQLHIRTDWLPDLMPAYQKTGILSYDAANQLSLREGIPVYHGAGDAGSAAIGSGAGEPGRFYVYLGTSGWLGATGFNQKIDPLTGIWNLRHINPNQIMYLGPMMTTAGNWEWIKETFGELEVSAGRENISPYEAIETQAASSPAGCNGLLYLPMINGERAPIRDPNARGVFFGINKKTERADLYRSVLEGVAYAMRSIRDVMQNTMPATTKIDKLYLTGGGARSKLWAQIFADVMNCPVFVLSMPEDVGVKGMAIVAGKALGWHDNYFPGGSFIQYDATYWPSDNAELYKRRYGLYQQLYPSLKELFRNSAKKMVEE